MHVGVIETIGPVLLQLCHVNNVGASEAIIFGSTDILDAVCSLQISEEETEKSLIATI